MTQMTIDADLEVAVENAARGYFSEVMRCRRNVVALGAATAITLREAEDKFGIILALTDNTVVTLPAASEDTLGMQVTVVNVGADGAAKVSISPAAADGIYGTVQAVASGGVDDKDWINTKATALKGDYTQLVCDGSTGWFITGGVGVWASE